MGHKGELSKYHEHNDGTSGWDINIKDHDGLGNVDDKIHVSDQSNIGESGSDLLSSVVEAVGSVFFFLFSSDNTDSNDSDDKNKK